MNRTLKLAAIALFSAFFISQSAHAFSGGQIRGENSSQVLHKRLLTDQELFQRLTLGQSQLVSPTPEELANWDAVRLAVAASDYGAAKRALATYYIRRNSIGWYGNTNNSSPVRNPSFVPSENASRALKNCVLNAGVEGCFGQLDEHGNPILNWFFKPRTDLEWQWQLNRMYFSWDDLGLAYWNTLDPKYSNAAKMQLQSWIEFSNSTGKMDYDGDSFLSENDYNGYHVSVWRTIETGIRLSETWPNLLYRIRSSFDVNNPADVELLIQYLKSIYQQANHLRSHTTAVGNWIGYEMTGLYAAGAIFPEFTDAAAWRSKALSALTIESARQFYRDGAQVELSTSYHTGAVSGYVVVSRLAKFGGRESELASANFLGAMKAPFEFLKYLLTPGEYLPALNDAGNYSGTPLMRAGCDFFPASENAEFCYLADRPGSPPTQDSKFFPNSGYSVMRENWTADANYLVFDAGPSAGWHAHRDKLNLILYAKGRELLFDNGGGPYEDTAFRRYGISTYSHNSVVVDSLEQRRSESIDPRMIAADEPELADANWLSTPDFDRSYGVYDQGYTNGIQELKVQHERQVVFVKPDMFIVVDVLTPSDSATHTYEALWHLKSTAIRKELQTITTMDIGKSNLAIQPLFTQGLAVTTGSGLPAPQQAAPFNTKSLPLSTLVHTMQGWSLNHDSPVVTPATTVRHSRTGAGRQYFVTLLYPLAVGTPPTLSAAPYPVTNTLGATVSAAGVPFVGVAYDKLTGEIQFTTSKGKFKTPPLAPGFSVTPKSLKLFTSTSAFIGATGGKVPYSFSIIQGAGSITPEGFFTAARRPGETVIRASDADGNGRIVKVSTLNPLTIGGTTLTRTGSKISDSIITPTGDYELVVSARGTVCQGAWPKMRVTAGPSFSVTQDVPTSAFTDYRFSVPLRYGLNEVSVSFLNDCYVAGAEDRNLEIGGITLNLVNRLVPLDLSLLTTADRFRIKTTGGSCGTGCWNIWSNGYLEEYLAFPSTGSYNFSIQARGSLAAGIAPRMEVRIDQKTVYSANITSTTMTAQNFSIPVSAGYHHFEIVFTNDYKDATGDRNLYIGSVRILR